MKLIITDFEVATNICFLHWLVCKKTAGDIKNLKDQRYKVR